VGGNVIGGVIVTPLKVIDTPGGHILHGMKCSDEGYDGFGEAYFSMVDHGVVKGWKRHTRMTLNLVVPMGEIRFVIFDDRASSVSHGLFQEVIISKSNYCRLTVPPMVWMGFQGVGQESNMLLNLANIPHEPEESERSDVAAFNFDWSLNT